VRRAAAPSDQDYSAELPASWSASCSCA